MIKLSKSYIKKEERFNLTKQEKAVLKGIEYIALGKFGEKLGFKNKPICINGFWFDEEAGLVLPKNLPINLFSFLNEKKKLIEVKKELNFI